MLYIGAEIVTRCVVWTTQPGRTNLPRDYFGLVQVIIQVDTMTTRGHKSSLDQA
jgi:hypothetical protein